MEPMPDAIMKMSAILPQLSFAGTFAPQLRNTLRHKPQEVEPAVGIEPTTDGLQNRCSAAELSWLKHSQIEGHIHFSPETWPHPIIHGPVKVLVRKHITPGTARALWSSIRIRTASGNSLPSRTNQTLWHKLTELLNYEGTRDWFFSSYKLEQPSEWHFRHCVPGAFQGHFCAQTNGRGWKLPPGTGTHEALWIFNLPIG
jgi:hypothetical protein